MISSLPFCSKGQPCKIVCCSRSCTANPYVCRTSGCQCDQPHSNCKYLNWETLLVGLQNKMTDPRLPVFLAAEDFLRMAIEELQAELEHFRQAVKVTGLTPKEQEFLRILQHQKYGEVTGKFVDELEKDLEVPVTPMPFRSRQEMELEMVVWRKQLQSLLSSIKAAYSWNANNVKPTFEGSRGVSTLGWSGKSASDSPLRSISNEQTFARNSAQKSTFQKQRSEVQSSKETMSQIEHPNTMMVDSRHSSRLLQLDSAITSDLSTLLSFFKPKTVRSIRLLFRASQHAFSTASFHHHCDVVPNTLTLVKTEFGCVIGGFTPLIWNKTRDGNYETDMQLESFLFSLTLRQKMHLSDPSRAIANDAKFGPVFGAGHDLAIADQANCSTNNMADFPTTYNNCYPRNQQTIQQFCGQSKGTSFRIQEWEVFEVRFSD